MFTVYQVTLTGLNNKAHLNSEELDSWMRSAYGKYATVKVIQDLTGKFVVYTDNGVKFEAVEKGLI